MIRSRPMRIDRVDFVVGLALFAAALLVRWPHLMLLPAFGDESLEVRWGFEIAMGKRLALTGHDPYYGPVFPYLIAAGFKLFGVHLIVPRAIIAVFGALTVPLTFWFGRVVGNRWTGLLAAVMVGTCPALALYSSHYGWSNSLTPFFATLAFVCLYIGVEERKTWLLAASGFLVALAVQTHPLTALPFAGAAVWLITSRKRHPWLTWRVLRRPALFCVLGYFPVILENIVRPLITLRVAFIRTYVFAPTLSPHEYFGRLIDFGRTLLDMLAGGLAFDRIPAPVIAVALAGIVLAAAVALDLARGNRLFSYALFATALVMPVFVRLYHPRYISFLLPIAYVMAATVIRPTRQATRERPASQVLRTARVSGLALAVVAVVALQASSFGSLARYKAWTFANGLSNQAYFNLMDAIHEHQACGRQLLVEDVGFPYRNPAWVGLYAVDYVLTLNGCEHRLLTAERTLSTMSETGNAWAIMSNSTGRAWPQQWHLEPAFALGAPTGPDLVPITLYRVTRSQAPE